jgi:hypothetical protein
MAHNTLEEAQLKLTGRRKHTVKRGYISIQQLDESCAEDNGIVEDDDIAKCKDCMYTKCKDCMYTIKPVD